MLVNLLKRRGGGLPQKDNLLQNIAGGFRAVGNFDGEDTVDFPLSLSVSGMDEFDVCVSGVFFTTSTIFAPILKDSATDSVAGANIWIERDAGNSVVKWFYGNDSVISNDSVYDNKYHDLRIVRSSGTTKMFIDGVEQTNSITSATVSNTTTVHALGGYSAIRAPQMTTHCVSLTGINFHFNTGSGSTVLDETGVYTATINDSTPNTFWKYEYAPDTTTNNLYALRDTATGNINPNPTANADLTTKGFTDSFMTRVALDALNDSIVDFVVQSSSPTFRTGIYVAGTTLSAYEITKANRYVFR